MNSIKARFVLAAAFLSILTGGLVAAPLQAVSRMPIGYWNLDDTASPAVDAIAAANAPWTGGPVRATTGLPVFTYGNASALTFSPATTDQYAQMPNSTALDTVQSNSYSISAWFNPASIPPGTGSANNANYAVVVKAGYHEGIIYDNAQQFEFQHWLTGNVWSGTGTWGTAYPPGSWYHVVVIWDNPAGSAQIWVNGTLKTNTAITANTANRDFGTAPWRIGIAAPGSGNYRWAADGSIDDVRIYNFPLTANEISVLYQGCPKPSGLTAAPGFNQVSLSWTAPTGPAVTYTYNVKRGTSAGSETLLMGGVSGTTFVDTTATPGQIFYYVVTAVSVGESGPSNEVSCRTVPIQITPTALTVLEAGGTATFNFNLTSPLANGATLSTTATVNYTSPGAPCLLSNGGALATSLPISFTGNGTALLSQTITVTGVDDFIAANPWTATITFSTTSSTDPAFTGANLPPVMVNQTESDFPGVIVTPASGVSITNGGPPVTFTVQLASKPTANIQIPMGVSIPYLATVAGPGGLTTLTFTAANWNAPQTVTITPLSVDANTTYITSFDITFTPVSGDASYQNIPVTPLPVFEPTSTPPLNKVWKCGLFGAEVLFPLGLLLAWRRRARRAC